MFAGLASPTHLLLILIVILLLFGAKRLPELGRSLGQSIQEFKGGLDTKELPEEEKRDEPVVAKPQKPSSQKVAQEEEVEEAHRKEGATTSSYKDL